MGRSIFEMTDEEIQVEMHKAQRNIGLLVGFALLALVGYILAMFAAL